MYENLSKFLNKSIPQSSIHINERTIVDKIEMLYDIKKSPKTDISATSIDILKERE